MSSPNEIDAIPAFRSPGYEILLSLLSIVAKRRRMIYGTLLVTALISTGYVLLLPNIYTARTMIIPAQDDKGLMSAMLGQLGGLASLATGAVGSATTTDLYVSMLKSEAVKDPIIERFRLMEVYKKRYRADVYATLDRNAAIVAGKKDGIITISVDDKDPKRAAEMANSYVEELGKLAVRLNVTGAGENRSFLEKRLVTAKADLAAAEEKLKTFQIKNKAVQMTAQTESSIKSVAEMRARLAVAEVQLATYRRQFTDSSQEIKNMTTSIANLKAQIAKMEGSEGTGALPSVGAVPALGQEYVRLMRDFRIQESLVEMLTKQYEMAAFTAAKDVSPFQVMVPARVPEKKSKPHRAIIVVMALLTTAVASVYLAVVLEFMEKMPDRDKERWHGLKGHLLSWRK